jgi:hypothetical protein
MELPHQLLAHLFIVQEAEEVPQKAVEEHLEDLVAEEHLM